MKREPTLNLKASESKAKKTDQGKNCSTKTTGRKNNEKTSRTVEKKKI